MIYAVHLRLFTIALLALTTSGLRAATLTNFTLGATRADTNRLDLGAYAGGTVLEIAMTGIINLTGQTWKTHPDGSLINFVTDVGYGYANAGATNYPTSFGGDGMNHFPGGGANYNQPDSSSNAFAFAGALTTDTTNPATIRYGSVVGTFTNAPARSDWFFIGYSNQVTVPPGGAHLYVAVVDVYYPNNSGQYTGAVSVVDVAPRLTIRFADPTNTLVGWNSATNFTYQLQSLTALAASNSWTNVGVPVIGNGTTNWATNPAAAPAAFFRLLVTP
ncbi:MAG: hypothetical protein HY301_07855 [Verrucomicrobia bacterium]|nr:hypothetical protein [Verrucomicrobiota bacterium]